ncbi:MAG: hypothetical protein R3191_05625, partial [Anaerolineales bacterium]|nr:hypothetical protein [Anaerolineales bacterium]
MARLAVTLIDVGWGDSILIESDTDAGDSHFALVDCNDTSISRSSYLYVKRHLERRGIDPDREAKLFDFVALSHGHADHGSGIQAMMSEFGTEWFWYPKSVEFGGFAKLLSYANRYPQKVSRHQAVDSSKVLPDFGDVGLQALWPPHVPGGAFDPSNENNNSIVLALTLGEVSFLLTGDCEASNWPSFVGDLSDLQGLTVFQVPHHGAVNGVFDHDGSTPWLDHIGTDVMIAMSSHIR